MGIASTPIHGALDTNLYETESDQEKGTAYFILPLSLVEKADNKVRCPLFLFYLSCAACSLNRRPVRPVLTLAELRGCSPLPGGFSCHDVQLSLLGLA